MDHRLANIAIFDSGVGGLSVLQEICKKLPNENIIYFADNANFPYGTKNPEQIKQFSIKIVSFLLTKEIKALVIACHTASAYAYELLTTLFNIPIIDIITPTIDYTVVSGSPHDHIGILATAGTIKSNIYQNIFLQKLPNTKITPVACPLLAPLVQKGFYDHPITKKITHEYLKPLKRKFVTKLILACTHFSLIQPYIQEKIPYSIDIINGTEPCATRLKKILSDKNILNPQDTIPNYQFFLSGSGKIFDNYNKNSPRNLIFNPIKITLD